MTKPALAAAYVSEEDRVLDPSLLEASAFDRLPQPTGWRILVLPYYGATTSAGGIALTKETVDREQLASVVARVVRMGSQCYNDVDKCGEEPWCQLNQWVAIGRYAGARFKVPIEEEDGKTSYIECRIINDDEVIATLEDPTDIVSFR